MPFVAAWETDDQPEHSTGNLIVMALTADVDAAVEGSCDRWVHLDEQILLLGQLFVATNDLFFNPVS